MYRRGRSERIPVLTNARLVVALVSEEPARCQVANGETFWQELYLGGCHYPYVSHLDAILVETDHVPDLDELGPSDNVRDQARDFWSHSPRR